MRYQNAVARPLVRITQVLSVAFLLVGLVFPAKSFAQGSGAVSDKDQAAIVSVISAQIEAMGRGDGGDAFSYAAPSIKARFKTSQVFMSMVRAGYSVLINPQAVDFLDMRAFGEGFVQAVAVTGQNGDRAIALYEMERQEDGAWLISGCVIRQDPRPQV